MNSLENKNKNTFKDTLLKNTFKDPSKDTQNNTSFSNSLKKKEQFSAIPMLSIKNIIVGSFSTGIPWIVLLFIVGFIIII
jgi:hypothetical protein